MLISTRYLTMVMLTVTLAAVVLQASQVQADDFELRAGLVISPGYKDTLDKAYRDRDVSGGYGWIDCGLAYRVQVADGFSVVPGGGIFLNYVTEDRGAGQFNMIILPSINGRYEIGRGAGLFLQGGFNLGFVKMGLNRLDAIDSGGIGLQILIGYQTADSLFFEGGYIQVPVTVKGSRWDENFGGLVARFGLRI